MIIKILKTIVLAPFFLVGAVFVWLLSIFVILVESVNILVEEVWNEKQRAKDN